MGNSAAIGKTAKSSTALIVILLSGSLTAGLGAAALFGWAHGYPLLAAFAPGLIPMAPSTALLFVLYGVGLIVFALVPASSRADGLGVLLSSAAAMLSLVILVLSARGIYPEIELLNFPRAGTLDGVPLGHMSPLTAFSFSLAGLACIGLFSSSRFGGWSARTAFGLAFLLVLISFVLLLGYGTGLPLLYESTLIPPAFPTSLACMSLGIGLLASAARRLNAPVLVDDASLSWTASVSTMIFVLMATGIITAGYLYSRHFQKKHRIEVEHQLLAIADLKVAELQHWRQERLRDAAYFFGNADFAALVSGYFHDPDNAEVRNRLQSRLREIQQSFHYRRVCLHDGDGLKKMSFPADEGADAELFSVSMLNTIKTGLVAFEDLYRNQRDGRIYLNVLIPVIPGGKQGNRIIGVLAFHLDPHEFLYPLLNFWPTPSETAETLMVRRDGPDVLFLNELRFQNDSALNLRIPLDREEVPAVRAVLGITGITEGMDYRDIPALAALRAVPDSPWFLIARMDVSEADAPVKKRRWVVISLTGALLVGAACGLGLLWRQQQVVYFRQRYEAAETLRASEETLRDNEAFIKLVLDNLPVGVAVNSVDPAVVFSYMNDNFPKLYRTTRDQLADPDAFWDVVYEDPDFREQIRAKVLADVASGDPERMHWIDVPITRKGQETTYITAHNIPIPGKPLVISTVWDVTARKQAEEQNVRLLAELEDRVRVRTAQLEAANKELEAFSYSVSHDLRAPLRAVDGYARILLDDFAPRLDAEGKRVCTVISESARAMGRLIDDLLAFSRVGRSPMQHAAIDMAPMVRSVFSEATTAEERARVDFRVGDLPAAVGDPNLIRQVWINLLANSVKFTANKELAVIEVEGRQQGSEIVYSVRDNGAGFDMRYADKLFGVFQRLHSTREFAGTGVGLAIVQRIVGRHNGRIWAEGAPGKGATFYFTLNQGE